MSDLGSYVQVRADRGEDSRSGRYVFGSGLVLPNGSVLTCAHVVEVGELAARLPGSAHWVRMDADGSLMGSSRLWSRSTPSGPDLAIIRGASLGESWPKVPIVSLDRSSRKRISDVQTIGYPRYESQDDGTGVVWHQATVSGELAIADREDGLLQLHVNSHPSGRSAWEGMSGAPVLVGDNLVGVVASHNPEAGSDSLLVTPLAAIEADPEHPGWGPGVENPSEWRRLLGVRPEGPVATHRPRPSSSLVWLVVVLAVGVVAAPLIGYWVTAGSRLGRALQVEVKPVEVLGDGCNGTGGWLLPVGSTPPPSSSNSEWSAKGVPASPLRLDLVLSTQSSSKIYINDIRPIIVSKTDRNDWAAYAISPACGGGGIEPERMGLGIETTSEPVNLTSEKNALPRWIDKSSPDFYEVYFYSNGPTYVFDIEISGLIEGKRYTSLLDNGGAHFKVGSPRTGPVFLRWEGRWDSASPEMAEYYRKGKDRPTPFKEPE